MAFTFYKEIKCYREHFQIFIAEYKQNIGITIICEVQGDTQMIGNAISSHFHTSFYFKLLNDSILRRACILFQM